MFQRNSIVISKVMCENGCERGYNLQPSKKIESRSDDIIRQIFAKSSGNQSFEDGSHQFDGNNGGSVDTFDINSDENTGSSMNRTKSHFVEIGEFNCGSIFGLGEHMDDRVIVAKVEVQCLLIPHYWLLQKKQNAGNIWQR